MSSIAYSSVTIQTASQSAPASHGAEVSTVAHYLTHLGILGALCVRVCLARHRFGKYELIDFFALLVGSALSGERTLDWLSWKQAALEMAGEEVAPLR